MPTGIPDFRSSMNTVLKNGPGMWELRAKGQSSSPKGGCYQSSVQKARPSPSHMALVKLHHEGLVKFTISQNVDGLHLRSGIRWAKTICEEAAATVTACIVFTLLNGLSLLWVRSPMWNFVATEAAMSSYCK